MLIVELPQLPRVSVLVGSTFESVILCRFVSLCGPKRHLDLSQRQVLSLFNRSNQRAVSRYLARAQDLGLLNKSVNSCGTLADNYVRGPFFERDSTEGRAMVTMSHSLWGKGGLLREWPYPTAWGYGCLPCGVIICMAVLHRLDESISKKSLRKYLETLVSVSSFNDSIRFLRENHLIYNECGRIALVSDWKTKVEMWLATNAACNERQSKGDARRHAESTANIVRISHGKLTDAERRELLALPCVVKECRRKSSQEEHFPPKKYLKHLRISTNRHLVWAICRKHNREFSDFIKQMPVSITRVPSRLIISDGFDPLRIYSAAANFKIRKMYSAANQNDHQAAHRLVSDVFSLWLAIIQILDDPQHRRDPWTRGPRRATGAKFQPPDASQLPLAQGRINRLNFHPVKEHPGRRAARRMASKSGHLHISH